MTGQAPTIEAGNRKGPNQVVRASTCTSRSHSGLVLKAENRNIVLPTRPIVSQIIVAAQQLLALTKFGVVAVGSDLKGAWLTSLTGFRESDRTRTETLAYIRTSDE